MNHKPDISKANACPPLPKNASLLDTIVYWLGIGLGSGLPRKAPGTWGTLGGIIVGIPLMMLGFYPFLIVTIISCVIGVWICDRTSKLMGVHDDPHIVFDEWVGIWIAMLPIAFWDLIFSFGCIKSCGALLTAEQEYMLPFVIIAFVLFRFFDILKPFPIGYIDKRLKGGFGIMFDDILAGMAVFVIVAYIVFYQYESGAIGIFKSWLNYYFQ